MFSNDNQHALNPADSLACADSTKQRDEVVS